MFGTAKAKPAHSQLEKLTWRELEVLALVADGFSNSAIAQRLYVQRKTVDAHMRSVLRKLDVALDERRNRRVVAARAYWEHVAHQETMSPAAHGRCPGNHGAGPDDCLSPSTYLGQAYETTGGI